MYHRRRHCRHNLIRRCLIMLPCRPHRRLWDSLKRIHMDIGIRCRAPSHRARAGTETRRSLGAITSRHLRARMERFRHYLLHRRCRSRRGYQHHRPTRIMSLLRVRSRSCTSQIRRPLLEVINRVTVDIPLLLLHCHQYRNPRGRRYPVIIQGVRRLYNGMLSQRRLSRCLRRRPTRTNINNNDRHRRTLGRIYLLR